MIALCQTVVESGNLNSVTDGSVGAEMCYAGLRRRGAQRTDQSPRNPR
ncbi:MAG: cyclodeaminase/cyclohydrolase family protein [Marinilabiliales bacterium]|nr:cyclodeaminase/cyclohydrolase family protein [Marinilabiliales bacterium]